MSRLNSVPGLSDLEIFEFDLRGILILREFIPRAVVDQANALIDRAQGASSYHKFACLELDPLFLDLIVAPRVVAICRQLCGPNYRLDHEYCIQDDPAKAVRVTTPNIHGGPWQDDGTSMYQWFAGRPVCGQIVIGFNLFDVHAGDGGLAFLPGSHKSNVPVNGERLQRMLGGTADECAAWHCFVHPTLAPGDLLVFSEALIHGTTTWRPLDRRRRILYYRFCPGHSAWRNYASQQKYVRLARNEFEARLLAPPYVGDFEDRSADRTVSPSWKKPTQS